MANSAFREVHREQGQRIREALLRVANKTVPEAGSRMPHAHSVRKLDGNPIVGCSRPKTSMGLFLRSGKSFQTPRLTASGSFKAAELRLCHRDEIVIALLAKWHEDARRIQWDYENIVRHKWRLDRLN